MNEQEIQRKNRGRDLRNNIIVILLSVILVVVGVLYYMQNREHQVIVSELQSEKDSIRMELNELVFRYDSLETENDTINEQLFVAQAKVKNLLIEIEQTKKISLEKINSYQNQVTTLRSIMRDFVVQIDSLNRRNQELMAENLEVKEQFKRVETEKQQISQDRDRLERNLQRAAVLQVREMTVEALNQRNRETRFANRAERLRIHFIISENVTSRRGTRNIYARIMRPDQFLLSKSADNLFQFENLKIQYSAMREVVYEGHDLPVAIFWDNSNEPELMPGTYKIDLFADGNNVGTTTFELR